MTPYEAVTEHFKFPFEGRSYQVDEVNRLAPLPRAGYYWEPGAGKTFGSTVHALYLSLSVDINHWFVFMPPILLRQWQRWLQSVREVSTGQPLRALRYEGTKAKRSKLDLDQDFILASYGLLKNDYDYLFDRFSNTRYGVITDEATAAKNIESDTHKAVKTFSEGVPLLVLTGTPLSKPGDAYAYIKLIAPGTYRNQRHFNKMHAAEFDAYDNVQTWKNLDLLAENMKINTSRLFRREVRTDLPPEPQPNLVYYELSPAHMKLYHRIAEERLVELDNGTGVIDAVSAQALRTTLQQVVVGWTDFAQDESVRPAAFDIVENYLQELGGKKLVVVCWFRNSNERMMKEFASYNPVVIYGGVTGAARDRAIQKFMEDPDCSLMFLQPSAGGMGVDGLQHVCSDMLFVECPTLSKDFTQTVARLDRDGQEDVVNVRVAIAEGTVQVRMFKGLLNNDELVNSVQGSFKDLREAIYGG